MTDDIIRRPMFSHEHKWFVFQIKNVFEPTHEQDMYRMIEYAYSGCNCGDVIKIKVKNQGE